MRDGTSGAGMLPHRLDCSLQCVRIRRIRNILERLHRFHGGNLMVLDLQCLFVKLVAGHTAYRTQYDERHEDPQQHPWPLLTLARPCRGMDCVMFHSRQLRFVYLRSLIRLEFPISKAVNNTLSPCDITFTSPLEITISAIEDQVLHIAPRRGNRVTSSETAI